MKYIIAAILAVTFISHGQITVKDAILKAGVNNGLLKNINLSETDILTVSLRFNPLLE